MIHLPKNYFTFLIFQLTPAHILSTRLWLTETSIMTVPTRSLGRNSPQVAAVGFGAMSLGGAYGQQDTAEDKLKVLDRAYEIGERSWDTADVY